MITKCQMLKPTIASSLMRHVVPAYYLALPWLATASAAFFAASGSPR